MFNLKDEITNLLEYKNISKAELSRLLNITPQLLNDKLNTKNLNLQFLIDICNVLNCNLQIYFQDNKFNSKINPKTESILNAINKLTEHQQKLILDLINQLKG